MLERVWRKGNPLALLVGMQTDTATMDNSMDIPLKSRDRLLHYTQSHYRAQTLRKPYFKKTCVSPKFTAAVFSIARTWKQPRCSSADEWIRRLWYIYTMEYYSAIKKNTFESVLKRLMKQEPIIQSEVSQKEKHQYSILMHIYGI